MVNPIYFSNVCVIKKKKYNNDMEIIEIANNVGYLFQ